MGPPIGYLPKGYIEGLYLSSMKRKKEGENGKNDI
jgi:hypothetical protein